MTPELPPTHPLTAEEFLAVMEGHAFPAAFPEKDHFECDWCSKGVPYKKRPRVGQYLSNRVPHDRTEKARTLNKRGVLTPMATYCEDCTTKRLLVPAEGYTEARLLVTISESQTMTNPELTDVSPADAGIPWSPEDVFEQISQLPYGKFVEKSDVTMAPENLVTWFLASGPNIDIRELIQHDGSLDEQKLVQAREAYRQWMANAPESREEYRDRVRGDR
jgi:hypothetical protein